MVLIVDKKTNIKKAKGKLKSLQKKNFDANDFLGKIPNWGAKDGVEYQRKLRDEW